MTLPKPLQYKALEKINSKFDLFLLHLIYTNKHFKSNKRKMNKIYLAIPYTWNPDKSFEIANKVTADLMSKGNVVFSPISHSHPVADFLPKELRTNSEWWMQQDLPLVQWADEIHVVHIGDLGNDLICNSKGVCREIEYAKQLNKPIKIIEYYD
jgi:nucleoside 2-deoxyribosyltransferase